MEQYFISIHQSGSEPFGTLSMQLISASGAIEGATSGSMFGHACATNALSVGSISRVSVLKYVRPAQATECLILYFSESITFVSRRSSVPIDSDARTSHVCCIVRCSMEERSFS